jgi:hypothetical protein
VTAPEGRCSLRQGANGIVTRQIRFNGREHQSPQPQNRAITRGSKQSTTSAGVVPRSLRRAQVRLIDSQGGGEVDVHAGFHRHGFRDGDDVGDRVGIGEAHGSEVGPSWDYPDLQPS